MKHSQTKAPQDITCNSQETSNIFGTKITKITALNMEKGSTILKSRNNLPKI